MPRTVAPPTPAPSNDISAKTHDAATFDSSFILPPAALSSGSARGSSSASSAASDSSYRPLSPTSPAHSSKPAASVPRKRPAPSQSVITKDDYALPPPPTRSRKIIQMKPQGQEPASTATASKTGAAAGAGAGAGGKKKQANGATAAGRKIARKTAHSLIERRRRSKMNEEFGVLKDMIPACAGQEMHKLAILQASIDYMRYLEQCVVDLKASHRSRRPSPAPASPQHTPPAQRPLLDEGEDMDDDDDDDEDMSDAVSPTHHPTASHFPPAPSSTTSPALYPSDCNPSNYSAHPSPAIRPSDAHSRQRHYSLTTSPALQPSDPHHYSLTSSLRSTAASPSIQPSPAFSAQSSSTTFRNPFTGSVSGQGARDTFSLTSPTLGPEPDDRDREDHEATEALLMLNTDRRSWGARGMSVRDLLSG